jgi:hypothetical protein
MNAYNGRELHFQISLMFASKARAYHHLLVAPFLIRLILLPTNIRQSWKGLPWPNTQAYYKHSHITVVKCFITFCPGDLHYYPIKAVTYGHKNRLPYFIEYSAHLSLTMIFGKKYYFISKE